MYDAKQVLGSYLHQLTIRKTRTGHLHGKFSIANLYKYLKEYKLVHKDIDDKEYGQLIIAVRNEWNSIRYSVESEQH